MPCSRWFTRTCQAGGYDSDTFGIGDLFAEGTLSWHIKQFDFSFGAGVWTPTGDSSAPPTTEAGGGLLDAHAHRRGHLVH